MTSSKKHILVLPSWYPNDFNKRNGIFNQYYIDALSSLNNISVLHVEHRAEVQSVEIRKRTINNVLTIFVYVPIKNGFSGKIYNQSHFIKACEEGFKVITEEKGKVDLVHNMVIWKMGLFALRLKKKLNIPYIVTEHSTALMDKHKAYSSLQLRFIKKVLIQADKVTAVSKSLLDGISKLVDIKEKGIVIPNIVHILSKDEEKEIGEKFVHVSSLNQDQKNTNGILQAIKDSNDATLDVIGGSDPNLLQEFKKLVHEMDLNEKVNVLGNLEQEEMLKLLPNYTAMIHFSNYESFSLVCAEAMAVGLPVIYTACGGPEEFMTLETGVEVPIGDVNRLTKVINKFLLNDYNFNRDGIRKTFKGRFNNEETIKSINSLYKEIE